MIKFIYKILFTAILCLYTTLVYSANITSLGASGSWAGGTLTTTITVNLTGDIKVNGVVEINDRVTLTINANGAARTIKANANISQIFYIKPGGKLKITGQSGQVITIDGGATFGGSAGSTSNHPFTNSGTNYSVKAIAGPTLHEAIRNENGTLELTYVKITNVNGAGNGGGILIDGANSGDIRQTTLKHCTISNCYSKAGSAIHIVNTNDAGKGSAENTRVLIEDSTIEWNYAIGNDAGGEGGTIRTNGSCLANLYMTRVTVQNNYTAGSGGGIYWNAAGSNLTECVFNGCTFTNNGAKGQGGAMMLESNFRFNPEGTLTTISNNNAVNYGGGIVITSYGGGAFTVQPNDKYYLTYTFTDKLKITNNIANVGGGISFNFNSYDLNDDFISNAKNNANTLVSTTINFNGATITNNTARNGEAGGIRIYNNTGAWSGNKRTIEYHINVNGGTISNNTAQTTGGGIYTFNADIKYDSSKSTSLTISENSAGTDGGGIYVQGGKSISLGAVSLSSNSAPNGNGGAIYLSGTSGTSFTTNGVSSIENNYCKTNGGAVYVSGGTVSLNTPTITGNGKNGSTVETDNGGAVYVTGTGSGFTATGTSEISNNASTTAGGAIYVSGGNIKMAGTTLSGNHSNNGGAAYVLNGGFTTTGTTSITNNYATTNGGAVYVSGGSVSLKDPTITGNGKNVSTVETDNGGAVYVTGANSGFTANGTSNISNNASTVSGGAVYSTGKVTFDGAATISGNNSVDGGAIYTTGNVEFKGNSTIKGNYVSTTSTDKGDGGAIYVKGGSVTAAEGTTSSIENNYSTRNGGAMYVQNGAVSLVTPTIKNNGKSSGDSKTLNGGAIYVTGTGSGFTATGNSIIENNASTTSGGAIYVSGGNINMAGTTLSGNNSKDGGAAYVSNGSFTTTGTTSITNNYATTDGGAVYVSGGTVTLNTPTITGNGKNGSTVETDKGGAVYVTGTGSSVTLDGVSTINGNSAQNGGAIYTTGNVDLKGNSTMENNVATEDGGVIYVDGGNISSLKSGSDYFSVTAKNNTAVNGGAFRVNGSIDLGYTLMNNNTASENGGAVALYNGTFSMKNDDGAGNKSTISHNTASNYGGGLYINNDGSSSVNITWNGGVFTNNKAKAGGAVSADGNIALTFAATMENNQAEIGGGLYINNGVDMEFGSGLVRGNSATQPTSNTTVYATSAGKDASNVSGVGGGIFMAKNSKLTFTNANELGIYNNFASNAGADICSNGDGTTITLPNVTNMQLTGFDVPGNKLYWMEDYFKGETYSSNVTFNSTSTGVRYEEILKDIITYDLDKYKIEFAQTNKSFVNYICLDLGYDLVYVNFTVEGLDKGDVVAIICNYPKDGDYVQYRKVLFVGNGTSQPVTKQISLPSGYWSFAASDWSYNYSEPSIFRANETTAHTGNIFISRKDSDEDANGNDVAGFRVVKAKFETKTPPAGSTEPNKYNVKQSQSVKVNRMGKNVTNN